MKLFAAGIVALGVAAGAPGASAQTISCSPPAPAPATTVCMTITNSIPPSLAIPLQLEPASGFCQAVPDQDQCGWANPEYFGGAGQEPQMLPPPYGVIDPGQTKNAASYLLNSDLGMVGQLAFNLDVGAMVIQWSYTPAAPSATCTVSEDFVCTAIVAPTNPFGSTSSGPTMSLTADVYCCNNVGLTAPSQIPSEQLASSGLPVDLTTSDGTVVAKLHTQGTATAGAAAVRKLRLDPEDAKAVGHIAHQRFRVRLTAAEARALRRRGSGRYVLRLVHVDHGGKRHVFVRHIRAR